MLKIKDSEGLEFVTEGRLYTKGTTTLIQYDETEMSGFEGCTTSLTITPTKVKMRRSGENLLTLCMIALFASVCGIVFMFTKAFFHSDSAFYVQLAVEQMKSGKLFPPGMIYKIN